MKKTPVIILTFILFALSLIAKEKELVFNHSCIQNNDIWEIHVYLDSSLSEPEAIQVTLVGFDPSLKFKNSFFTTYYLERLKQAKNENDKTIIVYSHIEVTWEKLFEKVMGSDMLLITRKIGKYLTYSSDSPISIEKKWIISSIFYIDEKPYCYIIPIELKNGTKLDILLGSSNRTLLTDLCEL